MAGGGDAAAGADADSLEAPVTDYRDELDAAYREAGSLRNLVEAMRAAGIEQPASIADWSRILRGVEMPYPHQCQVARLRGLPTPPMPPLVEAEGVGEWHKVGKDPARFGLLVDRPGEVAYSPSDNGATALKVGVHQLYSTKAAINWWEGMPDYPTVEIMPDGENRPKSRAGGNVAAIRAAAARAAVALRGEGE